MMNWCEGLTLRSGDAAWSDWQSKMDNIKIAWRVMLVSCGMIILATASTPARINAKLALFVDTYFHLEICALSGNLTVTN